MVFFLIFKNMSMKCLVLKENTSNLNIYRQISLLSVLSKVLEIAVKKSDSYVFVKALLNVGKNIYEGCNNKLNIGGVFVDMMPFMNCY